MKTDKKREKDSMYPYSLKLSLLQNQMENIRG